MNLYNYKCRIHQYTYGDGEWCPKCIHNKNKDEEEFDDEDWEDEYNG